MIDNKESEGSNANQENEKTANLAPHTTDSTGEFMTTNTGLRVNDDQNSLKAGDRGATLLEDFILREKITHFDHERIPERVVHARGSGAHGVFKVYEPMSAVTKAGFLNDTSIETPVFVRFSTVAGSKGSTDLARDVRIKIHGKWLFTIIYEGALIILAYKNVGSLKLLN